MVQPNIPAHVGAYTISSGGHTVSVDAAMYSLARKPRVGSIIFASYKCLNGGILNPTDRILMYVVKCLPDDDCGRVLNYLAVPMPSDIIVRDADSPRICPGK